MRHKWKFAWINDIGGVWDMFDNRTHIGREPHLMLRKMKHEVMVNIPSPHAALSANTQHQVNQQHERTTA